MAFALGVIFVMLTSACNREHCYQCYGYRGGCLAIKNTDTLGFGVIVSRAQMQDSMNLYHSLGYKIDTEYNGTFPDGTPCVGPNMPFPWAESPDSCVLIK